VNDRPEGELVASREAFEDLYRREFRAVLALAYALSGNRWVAEDLAQDTFLAAHREWARIGLYDDPGAWVRRVVRESLRLGLPAAGRSRPERSRGSRFGRSRSFPSSRSRTSGTGTPSGHCRVVSPR
jgi:DNA-directed RNA polymerase specialized sigma24 family protein